MGYLSRPQAVDLSALSEAELRLAASEMLALRGKPAPTPAVAAFYAQIFGHLANDLRREADDRRDGLAPRESRP